MRKTVLFSICFLTFFLSNGQSQIDSQLESYILTTDGEKIDIAFNERITFDKHNDIEYCKSVKLKRVLKDTLKIRKTKKIKAKKIEKIIDGSWLYLPYIDEKGKLKIFRLIAKNENYVLGHSILKFNSSSPTSGKWKATDREYYLMLDHNYKVIQEGLIRDKDGNVITENMEKIKNEFGSCLNKEILFDNVIIKQLNPNPFAKEKVQKIKVSRFLYKTNQLSCM